MTLRRNWQLAAVFWMVLIAMLRPASAQEEMPPLSLTSRLLFGYADYSQGKYTRSGPSATLDSDLAGYWRSPRIFQFEVRPTVTMGTMVPGTEMGNALTGFSAMGMILQGSSFPLNISYSRSSSSITENALGTFHNGLLTGIEVGNTNSVFDINWTLRFRHLPVVNLDYKDSEYSSELPVEFGAESDRSLRHFGAHLNYALAGWHMAGWYQRTKSKVLFPNLLTAGIQRNDNDNTDTGFSVSRYLPLHSSLSLGANQSESSFLFDGVQTDIKVRNANASLISQPFKRLTTNFQAQYNSNLQDYQLQQALLGAGVPGVDNSTTISSGVPLTRLAAPYSITSLSGGVGYFLGHGFSVNGSAGESHSSNAGNSVRWSAGPSYQRTWRSGLLTASYTHSNFDTEALVVNTGAVSGTPSPAYNYFYQVTDSNTAAVNVSQNLPRQFRLTTAAHVSTGSIKDNGILYPNHDYGGSASLARIVGEWTFTGSVNVYRNDANRELMYNENTSKGISFAAAYRGLNLSVAHDYGNGLALQVGNSLVWVNSPGVVSPVLGIPVMSTTSGTTITGSYRTRGGRLNIAGNWGRFNYTTGQLSRDQYDLFNVRASYKVRRLRFIAGWIKQSQAFGSALGSYDTRIVYFQVERNFRVF
jgi:hypothetical protein